ncbi:MAG TPA: tetratricopeptide repeat protein, partial [Candidatus Kapabacteria bacterium]|nr:tetratricopeptide repeat protein [Candidatus Kapabacteria bacterium]
IPVPITQARYVRAVDLDPGNFKVVHHAFIRFDQTRESRRQDQRDTEPGFRGMSTAAKMPEGHFLAWQPGRVPADRKDGLAWKLEPGTDLVIEMHLRASGKPEKLRPSVAFYFTDEAPTRQAFKIMLNSLILDIPAGETNYIVEDQFVLPIDVELAGILPHAHFLARRMEGWAVLPDGRTEPLIRINDWDFNWQGDYRYEKPVRLPKGSSLKMRYSYDNSTNNANNPSSPPQRVNYGPQSSDEMAELWFQFVAPLTNDLSALADARQAKMAKVFWDRCEHRLRQNPRDAAAHSEFGLLLFQVRRSREAEEHLRIAISLKPDFDAPHYYLGLLYRTQNRFAEAENEFKTTLRLNAQHSKAHGNLGYIYLSQGKFGPAEEHFKAAIALNPDDKVAADGLADAVKLRQQREQK